MKYNCLILCGGYGSRLKQLTKKTPKPLLKINSKPFLYYLLNNLKRFNLKNILILSHYKSDEFKNYLKKNFKDMNIKVINEKTKLGTGGSILNSIKLLEKKFYIFNGDTFFDINILNLEKNLGNADLIIAGTKKKTANYSYTVKYNNIINKKDKKNNCLVSGGIYFARKSFFKNYVLQETDLDKEIIWPNINKKKIKLKIFNNAFHDIGGSVKEFKQTENFLKKNYIKPCCFLDRDGVLNDDTGYVHTKNKFKWKNNVIKAIKYLNEKNYYVLVLTNQAGVAHGYYKEKDITILHNYINKNLYKYGAHVDRFYFCPHHPKAKIKKYKTNCNCRKPNIGMFKKAFNDFTIFKTKSFFIGDRDTDKEASSKIGLRFYWPESDFLKQIKRITK
jgi:D,D-heptose 1,7-bisphosphate phosphatase